MTEQNAKPVETETVTITPRPPKRFRKSWLVAGAVGLAGLAGFGAIQAFSQPFGHRGFGMHGTFDPASMGPRIDFGVDIMLGRVGANDEQKKKIADLIKANLKDVPALREQHLAARTKVIELLKAEKLDAAELERIRARQIASVDEVSKRVTQAVGEAANILTPKQRQDLVALWEKRPQRRW